MIRKIIRNVHRQLWKIKMAVGFIPKSKQLISSPSYYTEGKRKSNSRILCEMLYHIVKYGEVNKFYFAYGLDRVGLSNGKDYMAYSEFMEKRNQWNYTRPYDYLCLLRDKSLFGIIARTFNFPVPEDVCVIENTSSPKHCNSGVYNWGG